jgi:hypothetical protein
MFTTFQALTIIAHHIFPLLLKPLSERSGFPFALRGTRVVFLSLEQLSSELETEAKVILTLLIKLIGGKTDAGGPRPGWMRVLGMEIMRGKAPLYTSFLAHWLTGEHAILYMYIYMQALRRCRVHAPFLAALHPLATDGDTSSASSARVFTLLISALKRLITSRLVLLGVSVQMHGGVPVTGSQFHLHSHFSLDSAADGDDGCQRDGVERRWDNWR